MKFVDKDGDSKIQKPELLKLCKTVDLNKEQCDWLLEGIKYCDKNKDESIDKLEL
jgi:Ca2+-binding EF-hand superfamily protein